MLRLFVSVLFVSFATAAPGLVGHYPGAVSHVSRVDVHDSKPIISGYGTPYGSAYGSPYGASYGSAYGSLHGSLTGSPYGYPSALAYAPYLAGHYGYTSPGHYGYGGYEYPPAQSYSNRIDIHSSPIYGHGYGGYGLHDGSGYGYALNGYGIHGLEHAY